MKAKIIITILLAFTLNSKAQYTMLHAFPGLSNSYDGGARPNGDLFFDGTFLYGMTSEGGLTPCPSGCGTIFKVKPDGTEYSILLNFSGTTDGKSPRGSFISDGTYLYGSTGSGGINNMGTIFKIKPDGSGYSKLLDFDGTTNGNNPGGSFISDGTYLYGMTNSGGVNNLGVIFKIKPDGTAYSKILDFSGIAHGSNPGNSLISDGTYLYGMTSSGGTNGYGVIFKVKPDGTGFSKLLDFSGTANGRRPFGSLISDGTYLYGMTLNGGTGSSCGSFGCGVLFKIKFDGTGFS